ncbi:glycoside hydrolase family 43 protein [Leifsonia aquatica]|uniref:glycoside hydrolase family 43 protein n=1 Tax=Leifsonia aquatica TaxID=144185 RepID=UPI00382E403B
MRSAAAVAARAAGALAAAGVALAALSGCSGGAQAPTASAAATEAARAFAIDQDFADPDVLVHDGTAYAFATNTPGFLVRSATSTNMRDWTVSESDALEALPAWAQPGRTWAPEVAEVSPGAFVLYLTAQDAASGRQCIGTATSSAPGGPFTPASDSALVCPVEAGGAIDAATFRDDDGSLHLLWKTDGNCCDLDTWIETAPLSADGLSMTGPPVKLLKQDRAWEGALVEAPDLVKRDGVYVLFFSANDYGGDDYAIGTATGSSLTAPFTSQEKPFLTSASTLGAFHGPGGQNVVTFDGRDYLVFHSWDDAYAYRGMLVRPLTWDGATPVLG